MDSLERLRDHEITIRRAAELADVSYGKMFELASEVGVDVGYTTDDLERDRERI